MVENLRTGTFLPPAPTETAEAHAGVLGAGLGPVRQESHSVAHAAEDWRLSKDLAQNGGRREDETPCLF